MSADNLMPHAIQEFPRADNIIRLPTSTIHTAGIQLTYSRPNSAEKVGLAVPNPNSITVLRPYFPPLTPDNKVSECRNPAPYQAPPPLIPCKTHRKYS